MSNKENPQGWNEATIRAHSKPTVKAGDDKADDSDGCGCGCKRKKNKFNTAGQHTDG